MVSWIVFRLIKSWILKKHSMTTLIAHHEDIFETIRTTKDLPEESVLNEAIQAFKDQSEYK